MDETDGRCNQARQLVERLHSDMSYITMLGGKELEMLTDMDPESLSDIDRLASTLNRLISEINCHYLSLLVRS